ncbi:adenylate/guanylate cyclase domain-containing protein [uncultured Draconibacterium sp.]|uniref:adenylate/guanylate cyclase domain-containing protein n=1 Tax=uncultured Draconibacterium sp. TaxID=1573823 RepID=UPI0025F71C44|nr:adenylate/guanylate cyclase domain-containing protein [uncultured Draconibacterium sp.]
MGFKLQKIEWQREWIYQLLEILFYILIWNILFFVLFSFNYLINPEIFEEGEKIFRFVDSSPLIVFCVVGLVAVFSWCFENKLIRQYIDRFSVLGIVVFNVLFILVIFLFVSSAIALVHYWPRPFSSIESIGFIAERFFFNNITLYFLLICVIISYILSMMKIVSEKVGDENFYEIISGYYKKPREVNRIFIFIDLISSTQYAEILGHNKYSHFIQECFKKIGHFERKFNASQYQFVGDEVVVSWPARKEKNYKRAVDFFFYFTEQLRAREEFFMKEFGIVPKFTASINSGQVMMAEVGDVKSEIAFHGDVLNTAARIQKHCKSFDASVLATRQFVNELKQVPNNYNIQKLGNVSLKGKKEEVEICSIL